MGAEEAWPGALVTTTRATAPGAAGTLTWVSLWTVFQVGSAVILPVPPSVVVLRQRSKTLMVQATSRLLGWLGMFTVTSREQLEPGAQLPFTLPVTAVTAVVLAGA
jgi:hypothetical protein